MLEPHNAGGSKRAGEADTEISERILWEVAGGLKWRKQIGRKRGGYCGTGAG